MRRFRSAIVAIVALLLASPVQGQQPSATPAPASSGAASGAGPAVTHLVYRFGYNTKATNQGTGTGTTTIDIGGPAKDGGVNITATDDWWNTVNPRQSYTCEVYPNGGVTCAQPPYAISPIQIAIVPLLAQNYFTALSQGPNSTWSQSYNVRATFAPAASTGFAGQVYTWNCAYKMNGKGTVPNGAPLILIHANGTMKQQGGRYITAKQDANIAFDPRINTPVLVDELITFVPMLSVNQYTIQLRLIRD